MRPEAVEDMLVAELEEVIGEVQDAWELEEGLNTVYVLETGRGEYVLKARTNDRNELSWFRAEPRIYSMLEDRENVPSPRVLYTDLSRERYENAFYVMERLEGRNADSVRDEMSERQLELVLRQYGRILGEIHSAHSFEGYGMLAGEAGELRVEDAAEIWPCALEGSTDSWIERIEDGWENVEIGRPSEEEIRATVPGDPGASLAHMDNRLDNLLVKDGDITGFLDWSHPETADPEYDLYTAEYLLIDWDLSFREEPVDHEKMREALFSGYEEARPREEVSRERRRLYRYATVLWLMSGFLNWGSGFPEEKKRRFRKDLRERLEREKPGL
ncbi:MAG: phosphotransferase family protein [Candidatus Nanohaloarchaea archaeon]